MSLNKLPKWIPVLFVISAFGPYLSTSLGIRVEHLIIYPMVFGLLFLYILQPQPFGRHSFIVFNLWLVMTTYFVLRTVLDSQRTAPLTRVISGAENFIQPLGILFVLIMMHKLATGEEIQERMLRTFRIIVILLCVNSIWSLISIAVDTTAINVLFWGGEGSVSSRAITNGRFSGIFNQPMEAGVAYSIGSLLWLYLMNFKSKVKSIDIFKMLLLAVGGLLTVSKIFLFGGIPLFLLGVLMNKKVRAATLKVLTVATLLGTAAYYFFLKTWTGLEYLLRFFGSNQDFITLLTAGRFGAGAQQADLFEVAWNKNWIIGQGFGAYDIYDSAYFNIFANGGTLGMILYVSFLLALLFMALGYLNRFGITPETKLFAGVVILVIFAGFGSPVFILNRVSIILWVTLGLLLQRINTMNAERKTKKAFDIKTVKNRQAQLT